MPTPEALARADRILDGMAVLWTDDREDTRTGIAEALDEARLLAEMAAGRERVQKWADAERVIAWMDTPASERKPAIHAFTAGNERQIAYRVEMLERKVADLIASNLSRRGLR
jgi:hypothetical protein